MNVLLDVLYMVAASPTSSNTVSGSDVKGKVDIKGITALLHLSLFLFSTIHWTL
jgi:hypothetical protein